jgi:helicase
VKRHSAGASGEREGQDERHRLPPGLSGPWQVILPVLTEHRPMRAVQWMAVAEAQILESRQHLVVCAPTNSGKTLVGYMVLLEALLMGRRAVLLEPLRALAQEKAEELTSIVARLSPAVFPAAPSVRLTTGDYRLASEEPGAPPPEHGELIVATPERFEAILRNPAYASWLSNVGAVVVDEAHLVGDARRGPTLELLIGSMLSLPSPPRLALLSATVGNPQRLQNWLQPSQLLQSVSRTPLSKEVWELDSTESPDDILQETLRLVLDDPNTAALIFVYRKGSAESLARRLAESLGQEVLAYHSGQSAAQRARSRQAFLSGQCRCVVSTTALAMGVNLPATHVFVRDTTFFDIGKLKVDQLLQILGRAGRGERTGTGIVLLRQEDAWHGDDLAQALLSERIAPIRSSFEAPSGGSGYSRSRDPGAGLTATGTIVASCLSRSGDDGLSANKLRTLLGNTLAGEALVGKSDEALRWLASPQNLLAYADDQGVYHLTALGRAGVRSMLPLAITAGVGQLVRDLMSLGPQGHLLRRWSSLDHLLTIALLSDRSPKLRRFSESLASQIDAWHESRGQHEKSLLFAEWIIGSAASSKASELLGSLGIESTAPRGKQGEVARSKSYVAMLSAIVLYERANGISVRDVEARWLISGLEGLEESWRDSTLWLLSGLAAIFEIRAFYHHLRETCESNAEDIGNFKRELRRIRHHAYELLETVKHCSPLGGMLRSLRSLYAAKQGQTVGVASIRKLEDAGVESLREIAQLSLTDLKQLGIQSRYASQIRRYIDRRLR